MNPSVTILGAGPSGLAAAITLARAGASVVVVEQRADVGGRYAGNLQMLTNFPDDADALDELRDLTGGSVPTTWPQRRAALHGPGASVGVARSEEPFGYLLMRGPGDDMLDGTLRDAAADAGVEFRFGVRGDPAEADIVATGGRSVQGVAREWYGELDMPDGFTVRFDDRVCPGGYGYLLVANRRAVLGAAVVKHHSRIEQAYRDTVTWFHETLGTPAVDHYDLVGSVDLFAIGSSVGERDESFVGEAGGFCDALFGFGMRVALQSGRVAAEAYLGGDDFNARRREFFGNRLETALVNRFLYEFSGNAGYRAFIAAAEFVDFRDVGRAVCGASRVRHLLLPLVRTMWAAPESAPEPGGRIAWRRVVK